jgi:hypothetical protein
LIKLFLNKFSLSEKTKENMLKKFLILLVVFLSGSFLKAENQEASILFLHILKIWAKYQTAWDSSLSQLLVQHKHECLLSNPVDLNVVQSHSPQTVEVLQDSLKEYWLLASLYNFFLLVQTRHNLEELMFLEDEWPKASLLKILKTPRESFYEIQRVYFLNVSFYFFLKGLLNSPEQYFWLQYENFFVVYESVFALTDLLFRPSENYSLVMERSPGNLVVSQSVLQHLLKNELIVKTERTPEISALYSLFFESKLSNSLMELLTFAMRLPQLPHAFDPRPIDLEE